MPKVKRNKRALVFFVLFGVAFWVALLQVVYAQSFECGFEPESSAACLTFPIGSSHPEMNDDTVKAVVIYACGYSASTDTLPAWWARIWNPDSQHSVPRFYKDNSLGKHKIEATPFGRDSGHCFKGPMNVGELTFPFFDSVMKRADTAINFANFDRDGNDTVDAVFFVTLYYPGNEIGYGGEWPGPNTYKTKDTSVNGDTIIIDKYRTMRAQVASQAQAVSVCAHEWGHALGLPDLYQPSNTLGLGSFSVMGQRWPEHRAVPFDPWSRWKLRWVEPTEVTSSLYQDSIPDYLTTGKVYKLSKDARQYFLVTNHWGTNPPHFWEEKLPPGAGF